jgi:hypothetical protein
MLLLNFSHPITTAQRSQIEELTGRQIEHSLGTMAQFDHAIAFGARTVALVDQVGLTPAEWQGVPLLVNLPGFAPAAACLLAELHGRIGHFPAIVRLKPVLNTTPTEYEVAEIVNLQTLREQARLRR